MYATTVYVIRVQGSFNGIFFISLRFLQFLLDLGVGSLTMIVCNDYYNHRK